MTAVATLIPPSVAVKLVNLAVKVLLYCDADKAIAATVSDSVMPVSLVSPSKAVRLFLILVAVSVTVKV